MLTLYLIRHAKSEDNEVAIISGGLSKTRLSEKGIIQAKALGNRLLSQGISLDEVYSSPAERALQTARIACKEIGYPLEKIVQCKEFLELSQGIFEGKSRKEVYTPELFAKIAMDPLNFKVEGGESQQEVQDRTYGWIKNNLITRYEQGLSVAVFSHAMAIRCLLRGITRSAPEQTAKIPINNTSVTTLKYNGIWNVVSVNDSIHLLER